MYVHKNPYEKVTDLGKQDNIQITYAVKVSVLAHNSSCACQLARIARMDKTWVFFLPLPAPIRSHHR